MSNIYIQEPPTSGKVLLVTSVGDIDVELWAKETPKTCRNFIQLCLEGYYDNTIFHRLVPGFIVQGGDPTGTGEGGESVYGKTFRDEFHQRLRFNRRGLLGMANAGPNDNASQFFFTLGEAVELNNKHTLFGKITGDTLFNMLKMGDIDTDGNERPIFPPKVIKTKVLNNPFLDIEPRDLPKRAPDATHEKKKKSQSKATKDFKLLSFGEEAEEDEEETEQVTSKMKGKSKSSHDLIDDPKLSSQPAVDEEELSRVKTEPKDEPRDAEDESRDQNGKNGVIKIEEEAVDKIPTKLEKLRQESEKLKKDLKRMRDGRKDGKKADTKDGEEDDQASSSAISEYKDDLAKYSHVKRNKQSKGTDRERETLALLEKFKKRIEDTVDDEEERMEEEPAEEEEEGDEDQDLVGTAWMSHKFVSVDIGKSRVIDANIYDAERYAIHDPRNPINKRKLEKSKEAMKEKKSRR